MKTLKKRLDEYIKMKRLMGFKMQRSEYELKRFIDFIAKKNKKTITLELVLSWIKRSKTSRNITKRKHLVMIRKFLCFLNQEDTKIPIPNLNLIPIEANQKYKPYVYTDKEIKEILKATRILTNFCQHTYETLFGLLAVTGMRIGEAIRLNQEDFNEKDGVLLIRDSKFGKFRELVLHKTTVKALQRYLLFKKKYFKIIPTNAFFISMSRKRLIYENINFIFIKILGPAGLKTTKPNRPRLHDLRHTFAIRSIIDCYKSKGNCEKRLYELSTYMGHSSPANTYWYLTAVPELLAEGVKKLEKTKEQV
ncbi:MAG: tyrosine-type recombinase/integrase [Oligoflexia bacterium]|nr:tyrosine-type recombinase/integrase [Oligoflexia bacterium]